jgi:hypothetical protein
MKKKKTKTQAKNCNLRNLGVCGSRARVQGDVLQIGVEKQQLGECSWYYQFITHVAWSND